MLFSFRPGSPRRHSGESRNPEGLDHEAMRLSYFLPAPGFRVKHGMTITKHGMAKKDASLFMSFTIIK